MISGAVYDRLKDFLVPAEPAPKVGELAVERGWISRRRLEECLLGLECLRAEGQAVDLSELLVRWGHITPAQRAELLEGLEPQPPTLEFPREGFRIAKYRVEREIGRGGMGVVYRAEDTELKRTVALKVVTDEDGRHRGTARLHREAEIVAQLNHPNIVAVHDVGVWDRGSGDRMHYIAMDLVEGRTLSKVLAEGRIPRRRRLEMMEEIAQAVAYAHQKGVVHRDLKPSNVLVDAQGKVYLTDFGLAAAKQFEIRLTKSQELVGTPAYMSPEQVEGRVREIDARTDVYALGVMLYEILTGRLPFENRTPSRLFARIAKDAPLAPSKIARSVERNTEIICLKAMEKDRGRRYANALELAEDLGRHLRGEPILAQPLSWTRRWRTRVARRKGWIGAFVAAGILGALLFAGLHEAQRTKGTRRLKDREAEKSDRKRRVAESQKLFLEKTVPPLYQLIERHRGDCYSPYKEAEEVSKKHLREALVDFEREGADPDILACADFWAIRGAGWNALGESVSAETYLLRAQSLAPEHALAALELVLIDLSRAGFLRFDEEGSLTLDSNRVKAVRARIRSNIPRAKAGRIGGFISEDLFRVYESWAEGKKAETLALCDEGLKTHGPIWGTEGFLRVKALLVEGREGIDLLTQAIKIRPRSVSDLYLRGRLRSLSKLDYLEAIDDFTEALRIDPNHGLAWGERGKTRYRIGDYPGANADCTEALRFDVKKAVVYNNRGSARKALGDIDGAIADFTKAIELDGKYESPLFNRAGALLNQGKIDEAIRDYEAALRIKPDDCTTRAWYAYALLSKMDYAGAVREYTEAFRLGFNLSASWHNRGVAKSNLNDSLGAIQDFTRALELSPRDALAHRARSRERWRVGDLRGALEDHWRSVVFDRQLAMMLAKRASELRKRGDFGGAVRTMTTAISLQPEHALLWSLRGVYSDLAKDYQAAISDLSQATRLSPYDADFWDNLSVARFHNCNHLEAVEAASKAIRLRPQNPDYWSQRGRSHYANANFKDALFDLRRALEIAPRDWPQRDSVEELAAKAEKHLRAPRATGK